MFDVLSNTVYRRLFFAQVIALLGTGLLGTAIGQRLLARGHRLTVWNRSPERCSIAGVWMAPPHTMTSRKLIVTGRSPSIVDVSSARSAVEPCMTMWSRR